MRHLARCAVLLAALPGAAALGAARPAGAGELQIDAAAVAALIEAGLPESVPVTIPGLGTAALRLRLRGPVALGDGSLSGTFDVTVAPAGLAGALRVRYRPVVDRESGVVSLRATSAVGEGPLALLPDLAPLLPAVSFPRSYRYPLGDARLFTLDVQGVEVTPRRLVIRFGVRTGARPTPAR